MASFDGRIIYFSFVPKITEIIKTEPELDKKMKHFKTSENNCKYSANGLVYQLH